MYIIATECQRPEKMPILKKVYENLDKSEENIEKTYTSGKMGLATRGVALDA